MTDNLPPSLGLLAEHAGDRFGESVALWSGQKSWTFGDLARAVRRVATALAQAGVRHGDRVTLYGENGWEWVVSYHAVLRAGAVVNPVNALLTRDEVVHIMSDCAANTVIVSPSSAQKLKASDLPALRMDYSEIAAIADGGDGDPPSLPEAGLAAICYTSGTTGRPKGAMQSHRAILHNVALTAEMHGKGPGDRVVSALPCPHVYGNVVMNAGFVAGSALELHERFDPVAVLDAVERGATMIEGVPTMYAHLLREPLEVRDLTSLRLCTVGGQTMPVLTMAEVEMRLGCPLIELWGMTELAGLGTTHHWNKPRRLGSIGTALPLVETRIDGDAAGPGELLVRGPIVMDGYWKDPDATTQAIDSQGWLRTGDIATCDAEGFLYIVDRAKDMILTAGYNIYPAELERVIAEHRSVSLVAVAGLPDALKGEVACAWVVAKPGCAIDADTLDRHCRDHLAAYKCPRRYVFVDDLPRTSSGKVLRRALANTLEEDPQ